MSVAVAAGSSIQTATDANPAGTVFLLGAGTHVQQNVLPKDGNQYIGVGPATILDGQNVATYAIRCGTATPNNVTVKSLRATNYLGQAQYGAIRAGGAGPSDGTTGWSLIDVEVDHCGSDGVRTGNQMTMTRVNMHHNAVLGFQGIADDLVMDDCESADNNVGTSNADAGGCKLVLSLRSVIKNSRFLRNNGPGCWFDIANKDYLIDNNKFEDNVKESIVIEIGYGGRIRRNQIYRGGLNDTRSASWAWGAGIGIHASGGTGIEIDENHIEGCVYGIGCLQQARGTNAGEVNTYLRTDGQGIAPDMYVQNINAHNNKIIMKGGFTGKTNASNLGAVAVVQDVANNAIFTSRNLTFNNNKYYLRASDTTPFTWLNVAMNARSYAYWQATAGMDAAGSQLVQLAHFRPGDR